MEIQYSPKRAPEPRRRGLWSREKMIRLCAVLLILMPSGCKRAERVDLANGELISVEVTNSLRIPAHRVKVVLNSDGKLERELENQGEEPEISENRVGLEDIGRVRDLIRSMDWRRVSKDKVLGLDGTSVRVDYQGNTYSVWTPSHDMEKRGLAGLVRLKIEIFRLAGFEDFGTSQ